MSFYQLRLLANMSDIGEPAPLPAAVRHLTQPELADLSWLTSVPSLDGKGYFPVDIEPPTERWLHKVKLLLRFPGAKRRAIRAAAPSDLILDDFLFLLASSDRVDLDDADILAGFGYLVFAEYLTEEEAEAILE